MGSSRFCPQRGKGQVEWVPAPIPRVAVPCPGPSTCCGGAWLMAAGQWEEWATGLSSYWDGLEGARSAGGSPLSRLRGEGRVWLGVWARLPWSRVGGQGSAAPGNSILRDEASTSIEVEKFFRAAPTISGPFTRHCLPLHCVIVLVPGQPFPGTPSRSPAKSEDVEGRGAWEPAQPMGVWIVPTWPKEQKEFSAWLETPPGQPAGAPVAFCQ